MIKNNYKVAAIIITYNIGNNIMQTYYAIKNQVDAIIFVDNNSEDNTIKILQQLKIEDERIKVISNTENMGIAKAINQGVNQVDHTVYDFILTLDHDSIPSPNMVSSLLQHYSNSINKDGIGIIAPAIYDINKKDFLGQCADKEVEFVNEVIQSGSLYKTELFAEVGYFLENLFIYYVDTDFCYRVIKSGYYILQCNKVILSHEEGKKTTHTFFGKKVYYNNYNEFAVYYRARNNVYMLKEHFNLFTSKNRLLVDLLKIIIFDSNKLRTTGVHIKGIIDGITLSNKF